MTDEPIPSLAEALTEIRHLRAQVQYLLNRSMHQRDREAGQVLQQAGERVTRDDVDCLRARIEAANAMVHGTLEQPTPDWPTTIEHNIPPNAPPHNE